jgi:DNA replication licensing factor MCM3
VDTPVWQRSGNGSSAASTDNEEEEEVDLLTKEFLRKYIHYSKSRIHPVLSEEAMERISSDYANMRAQQSRRNLPITARTLETMIRLATASAKSRLSQSVDIVDVDAAAELLNFVLFHEIGSSVAAAAPAVPTTTSTTPESSNQQSNQITTNSTEGEEEETASEESMSDLLISLCAGLAKMHNDSFEVSLLVSEFKRKHPQIKSDAIIQETIQQLEAANRIMVAEDMIFMV